MKINFTEELTENPKEIAKKLFVPPSRGAALTLPGPSLAKKRTRKGKEKKEEEKRFDNTLPDDMHFSSKQLVTLFLKPKFSVSASNSDFCFEILNSCAAPYARPTRTSR